ncbi:MAG: type III secretion system chaperone [Ramlibacter sp.]
MLNEEHLNQLMQELGPIADLLAIDAYPDKGLWHIAVAEDLHLFAELAAARRLVVLSAELGKPAPGNQAFLYELFLRYAHVWDASGGLRMSVDDEAGAVWLLLDVSPNGMSAGDLAAQIGAFAAKVRGWREVVGGQRINVDDPDQVRALLHSPELRA